MIQYCYHGMGRQLIPITKLIIQNIDLICQAGQLEFHNDCYRGMVMVMINNDRDPIEGFVFCKFVPGTVKEDCYDALGKWIIMILPSDIDREKACSQVESDQYFATCMNATLENIKLL